MFGGQGDNRSSKSSFDSDGIKDKVMTLMCVTNEVSVWLNYDYHRKCPLHAVC